MLNLIKNQVVKQKLIKNLIINRKRMQTNNTAVIPNVSCVFRELVQLSNTNPRLSSTQQGQSYVQGSKFNNFPSQQLSMNRKFDFVSDMGLDDRQRRHEQLMNRLKNSMQENRQLLGINSETSKHKYQHQLSQLNTNNNRPPYSQYGNYSSNNSNNRNYQLLSNTDNFAQKTRQSIIGQHNSDNNNNSKRWKMPQIRYRHIEDIEKQSSIKPKYQSSQSNSHNEYINQSQKQSKLQKQFYEDQQSQKPFQQAPTTTANKTNTVKKHISQLRNSQSIMKRTQPQQQEQNQIDLSLANKFSKYSSKQPSKYVDNLQSYYELCKKPIKPSMITSKQKVKQASQMNQDKFTRKSQPKVSGINLSKAIEILSLDD